MKKTSLTRALFVAGVMAVAGAAAQADAIFYPDGTHVELGANAVESGLADSVLARSRMTSPSQDELLAMGVLADQNSSTTIASSDDFSIDTRTLGAGPSRMTTTTVTTTTPVYVFPNIHFDRSTVLADPHRVISHAPAFNMDRTAAATFDSPMRAGEVSTMTSGAPNLVTTNESVATVPPPLVVDTTSLGAGPGTMGGSNTLGSNDCASATSCNYLPD